MHGPGMRRRENAIRRTAQITLSDDQRRCRGSTLGSGGLRVLDRNDAELESLCRQLASQERMDWLIWRVEVRAGRRVTREAGPAGIR